MNVLKIIDMLCDITTKQSDLLRELVTELEHTRQVSEAVKSYYRESFEDIERQLDASEYDCRRIEITTDESRLDNEQPWELPV